MDVTVDGRGTFSLSLESGNLIVALDGVVFLKTKGNPTKLGNPAFISIDEAHSYFQTLSISQPIVVDDAPAEA